jgi:hypothetical protein
MSVSSPPQSSSTFKTVPDAPVGSFELTFTLSVYAPTAGKVTASGKGLTSQPKTRFGNVLVPSRSNVAF